MKFNSRYAGYGKVLLGPLVAAILYAACAALATQPVVAIHDSELTRALDSAGSPAVPPTPTGPGTTGLQWWPTNWHYFVMPESVKEALRSDGTAFTVVGDSNITAGLLLPDGSPKYPILISLASEAVRNDELAPLTNYVAAGGFLLVGSCAFTRNPDGTPRGDFAIANEMGIHSANSSVANWGPNSTFTKQTEHRLVSHLPLGYVFWEMPSSADEIPWGTSPAHPTIPPHAIWQTVPADAQIVANGDTFPNNYLYLTVKQFGKGYFIYYSPMQPLIGHGGFSPGMYAYLIFKKAIEWAFDSAKMPIARISPWPYPYNAAFMLRHDLENFAGEIAAVESSAQLENSVGAKGSYYFCTGTLRQDMGADAPAAIAGLRNAVANYGALIGPHNGGLQNPNNPALTELDYDFWHWGPDEALDVTPPGYPDGKTYSQTSLANAFSDVEGWLSGLTNGIRAWVAPYFNATREDSYDIQEQLGVKATGEAKLTFFPHWTLSTQTPGKRYGFVSEPVSDWYVGHNVLQTMDDHTTNSLHDLIDFYYQQGGLINAYTHALAGAGLPSEYLSYGLNPTLHPRVWPVNALDIYQWWVKRAPAQISASYATNGAESVTTLAITGATDPDTAIDVVVPSGIPLNLNVYTNGVLAGGDAYRSVGPAIRIRVGTSITSTQVRYVLGPRAQDDAYTAVAGRTLTVLGQGVLANDSSGAGGTLAAVLVSGPTNGLLSLNANGSFTYTPAANFMGTDSFTYRASDGINTSSPATVTISVRSSNYLFYDDFSRATDPGPLSPWVAQQGNWTVTGGVLQGGPNTPQTYGFAYTTNGTNYAVETRIQFPVGSFGGGLSGRLNPATGAHYALWMYPGSAVLKLFKFQDWATFGYNGSPGAPMAIFSVPPIGAAWHTLKLSFLGNQIGVFYDSNQVGSVTDTEPQPHLSGGIGVDMWTDSSAYVVSLDDVLVTPLAVADSYNLVQGNTLTVAAPGVLGNDSAIVGPNLIASLISGPGHGLLNLNTDGSFSYTPAFGFSGMDSFTYQAMDGALSLGTATVTLLVKSTAPPTPPVIVAPPTNAPWVIECSSPTLVASVSDINGNPLRVVWTVNNVAVQTNLISGIGLPTTNVISYATGLPMGQYSVQISVSDSIFPPVLYSNIFLVKDTTPPIVACLPDVTFSGGLQNICTSSQKNWDKSPSGNNQGAILYNNFSTVYKSGFVEVGIPGTNGFSMKFTSAKAAQAYLLASGAIGVLTADATNPTSSSSGVFGAQVLALELNVDYNDAGFMSSGGNLLGNLVYSDPASPLNGMTVRQILALANTALGGGNISGLGLTLSALSGAVDNLNNAFSDCKVSNWALAHLFPSAAALPPSAGVVTATDNCDPNPVVTYSDSIMQGSCSGGYSILRTWKATDASGNVGTCVQVLSQISSNSSICGTVYRDCNADGSSSDGTGLAGVVVTLQNGLGVVLGATVTDGNGAYCFNKLPAGHFVVLVQPPANYVQSGDPDSVKDNQTVVALASCQAMNGVNFGYTGTAPALRFAKRGPATAAVGQTITYTFAVTNTGNTCFYGLQVTDPMFGGVILSQSPVSPGQVVTFTKSYTVKAADVGSLVSIATAVGAPPIGSPVSAQSTWTVTVFAVPTSLTAMPGNSMVSLSWNPVANAASYNVKRSTINGGPYITIQTGVTGTNFTDLLVTNGVPYYYVVSDVTASGESPNSAQVSAIPAAPLPSPWNTSDIGAVAAVGGANFTNGAFTVIGSGANISDGADEFRYVYQLASGDCSIIAHVVSLQNTDASAKAGVMIRESLATSARHASTLVTSSKNVLFVSRSSTGGSTTTTTASGALPYWVRLDRVGNTFSSYRSSNGSNWSLIGNRSITMSTNVYIGLAVTSRVDGVLCISVMDNVAATP
jgi:uncharacterized repeat protein (TIGR01451 family)